MATGGKFRRTVKGLDVSFDFTCSRCMKKNRNREATQYCVECQDFYCSACVECHDDIPALSGHKILGQSEFPTDGSKKLMPLPTDRCSAHPTKLVDMYCQNHDQIGCLVCMTVKHRSCKDLLYIPVEIENILRDDEMKQLKEDWEKANNKLSCMLEARQADLNEINSQKTATLDTINDFRMKINSRLDELEKITRETFLSKQENIQSKIKSEIASMNGIVKEMELFQQQLQSAVQNRSQQFVCLKKCQEKVIGSEKISNEIAKNQNVDIEFQKDERIMNLLGGLKSLGDITEKISSRSVQVQQHSALYKVTGRREYNVSTMPGGMFGSCIPTDGTLLLTYYNMKKLMRLDSSTYKLIDECDLSACPIAVCEISRQEAGVTLNNNTIQLVSLGSKMAPTRSIKMNHPCYGLAVSNGEMFVSDSGKNVYVHATSGTLLRTICKDQSGADIFSRTRHTTVSDDDSKIYVADNNKVVIVLDKNGRVLSRFCDSELSCACGVCTDGCNNVFVCGWCSNNVVQVRPSGDKIGVIAKNSDGISDPLSVCINVFNLV